MRNMYGKLNTVEVHKCKGNYGTAEGNRGCHFRRTPSFLLRTKLGQYTGTRVAFIPPPPPPPRAWRTWPHNLLTIE